MFAEVALLSAMSGYIFSRALFMIGIYVAITAWVVMRLCNLDKIVAKSVADPYLVLILLSLILSVIFGSNFHEGTRGLHKWLRSFFVFWASYDLFRDKKYEKRMIRLFVIIFLIATLDGLVQYFFGKDLIRGYPIGYADTVTRVTSSFGYFGMFASFLVMITPIGAAYAAAQKKKSAQTVYFLSIFLLSAINLYLTRTRGAWITATLVMILFLIAQRKWRLIFFLGAGVIAMPLLLPRDILLHTPQSGGIDKTIGHRVILWQQAVNILKAKPLTGCGLNTYVQNIQKYNFESDREVQKYYAHNGYLQHAAETGILGISVFLLFLGRYLTVAFRSLFRKNQSNPFGISNMLILSVCGFLFYMLFDTIFHNLQPFTLFWLLMGWSLSHLDQKTRA